MKYKKLYNQIWHDRKKEDNEGAEYVECEVTGKRIYGAMLSVHNFAHRKSKGQAPELKYDPDNIAIVSMNIHGQEHCSGKFNNYLPIQ
jgi:hypothetical protein